MTNNNIIYSLDSVSKSYKLQGKSFTADTRSVQALKDISCNIQSNSIFGIVGESGCGKSTLIRMLVGAEKPTSGDVVFNNDFHVSQADKQALVSYQSKVKMIFQDPGRSLNHRLTVGNILLGSLWYSPSFRKECVALGLLKKKQWKNEAIRKIIASLQEVGLDEHILSRYPTEFSGGQRQRIAFVRAAIHKPQVLICDEITSALDASNRRIIIDLLLKFKYEHKVTIIFVAHDLSLVLYLCDEVMVMSKGELAELAHAKEIFHNPQTQCTQLLLDAIPKFPEKAV